jgi:hypothetical protein
MITAKDLARAKAALPPGTGFESMGPYDHSQQRRWVGNDAMLITWSMKSDTQFDKESSDPD